jgi:hypothetical protein
LEENGTSTAVASPSSPLPPLLPSIPLFPKTGDMEVTAVGAVQLIGHGGEKEENI